MAAQGTALRVSVGLLQERVGRDFEQESCTAETFSSRAAIARTLDRVTLNNASSYPKEQHGS